MTLIWGRITSINVRKVIWTLQELGLPFERKNAGAAFGVVNTDEYAQLNPNRLVPLMVQGERTLWESNVIVRYLCAAEQRLCPADPWLRADAERWMDWQQTTFSPAGRDAFIQLFRKPEGAQYDQGASLGERNPAFVGHARPPFVTTPFFGGR